jgi:PAS domain S-box-containing protein
MTPASRALGRRLRGGYLTVLVIVAGGFVAAGWQITRVLATNAQHQRMIGVASRQSALSLRAADYSDGLFFNPSAGSREAFDKAIAEWFDDENALESFLDSVCGPADPLCQRFKELKSMHFKMERWLMTSSEWRTAAERDTNGRARDAAMDQYSEAVDEWTEQLAARLSAASIDQQRRLYVWSLVLSACACFVIVLILEPRIRQLQSERSVIDRWTSDREKLATVAERTHHSVFLLDPGGHIEWANEAFLRVTQRTLSSAVGTPVLDLLPAPFIDAETRARMPAHIAAGEAFQFDLMYRRHSGELCWGAIDCRPILTEGRLSSYFAIESDVTERKHSEEVIVRQRAMLAAIADLAGVGGWQLDLATEATSWSDTMFHIYELPIGPVPSYHDVLKSFPGEARNTVMNAISMVRGAGVSSDIEVPFVTAAGKRRWVRAILIAQHINERRVGVIGALQDITEARQTAEQLRSAKNAADAASTAKGLFLANMSHEIRTPLNGVIGMTELLLDTALSEQQREYADIARSSGQTLLALINDILDISKIEAGQLELENIDFNLSAVIDETLDAIALKASEKGLELLVDIEPECPKMLRGDPTRLRQVLLNLMSNAVKFTSRGDVILEVRRAVHEAGQVSLSFAVIDTGKGIAGDAITKLFTPFTQEDASTTRRHGGTGLGLSICRRLVEAMGGEIRVASMVGIGSTFRFSLKFNPGLAAAATGRAIPSGARALIIAEHAAQLRILSTHLMHWRFDVCTATTAIEGLSCWKDMSAVGRTPALVIVDRRLSDLDGILLAGSIRDLDPMRQSRLILLSSLNEVLSAEDREIFAHVITKPVKLDGLYGLLADNSANAQPDRPAAAADRAHPVAQSAMQLATQPVQSDAQPFLGCCVLLVDDNAVNRKVGERLLQRMGAEVVLASNGIEALARLRSARFDVVLMDCQMPEMDGYEATRQIRRGSSGASNDTVPIIALTANALSGDRDLCIAAGMDDYLTKPIDPQQLAGALRTALAGREDAPVVRRLP